MITKTFNDIALDNIAKRKKVAEEKALYNLNLAKSKTNYNKLFNKLRSLEFELAKLEYKKQSTTQIKEQIKIQKDLIDNELKKINLKTNDLQPQYVCKKCNDTGYINNCECECLKKEKNLVCLQENNIKIENLENFDKINYDIFDEKNRDTIKKIYKKCNDFVDKFYTTKVQNIILIGDTGVGKTYLTKCMLNKAITHNIKALFTTAFNLNRTFLKYHTAPLMSKNNILLPYLSCELLIIDDLGTENMLNNVTKEYLYLLISERNNNKLKTIISTNLYPDQLYEKYDSRIVSRIFDKKISISFHMEGSELRLSKNKTNE